MWFNDPRFVNRSGKLETRFLFDTGVINGSGSDIPGNGSRVALLLSALPGPAATVRDYVSYGPKRGANVAPLRVLSVGVLHCAIKLWGDGDVVMSAMSALADGDWDRLICYEVVFHPEGK